jgi:hypothetical protein
MRFLPLVVMLLSATPLAAAQAYRWVDKDGVVHFSDKPAEGAEKIPLNPAPKPGSVPQAYLPSAPQGVQNAATRYASCALTRPSPDQTFQHAEAISVVVEPQPALQRGDRVLVTLNGAPIRDWPDSATTFRLPPQPRGAYTLAASLNGPDGAVKCTSATVSFTVFQPTVLAPGRKPAPH